VEAPGQLPSLLPLKSRPFAYDRPNPTQSVLTGAGSPLSTPPC